MKEKNEILVGMDKYGFSNHEHELIITEGVSTCIALYFEVANSRMVKRSLYHWSGVPEQFDNDLIQSVCEEIMEFFSNLQEDFFIAAISLLQGSRH